MKVKRKSGFYTKLELEENHFQKFSRSSESAELDVQVSEKFLIWGLSLTGVGPGTSYQPPPLKMLLLASQTPPQPPFPFPTKDWEPNASCVKVFDPLTE